MLATFSGVELKDCIKDQKKKKRVVALCSGPPQNVKSRRRNVQNCVVHVQSCFFAKLKPIAFFCRSRCRRRRRCLSSLLSYNAKISGAAAVSRVHEIIQSI